VSESRSSKHQCWPQRPHKEPKKALVVREVQAFAFRESLAPNSGWSVLPGLRGGRWNNQIYYHRSPKQISYRKSIGQLGQVAVEYVLLLVVATLLAGLLVRGCVSRNEDDPGLIIKVWDQMLKSIGQDQP